MRQYSPSTNTNGKNDGALVIIGATKQIQAQIVLIRLVGCIKGDCIPKGFVIYNAYWVNPK